METNIERELPEVVEALERECYIYGFKNQPLAYLQGISLVNTEEEEKQIIEAAVEEFINRNEINKELNIEQGPEVEESIRLLARLIILSYRKGLKQHEYLLENLQKKPVTAKCRILHIKSMLLQRCKFLYKYIKRVCNSSVGAMKN